MTRLLGSHMQLGTLLLVATTAIGCSRSDAAPANKPPPKETIDPSLLPIPPEPLLSKTETDQGAALLAKLRERLILAEPDKALESESRAKAAFANTFGPRGWLEEALRKQIQVTEPQCFPTQTGCYVEVTYPDWTTFVRVNRAVLDHEPRSPFMSFPGPRYRTGRLKKPDGKFSSTWILSFQLKAPDGHRISNGKEAP